MPGPILFMFPGFECLKTDPISARGVLCEENAICTRGKSQHLQCSLGPLAVMIIHLTADYFTSQFVLLG